MNRSVVHTVTQISAEQTELIDGDMLSTREFARLCCVSPDWVHARIEAQTAQDLRAVGHRASSEAEA